MEFERVLYRVHASTLASLERNRERFYVRPLNACWVVTEVTFRTYPAPRSRGAHAEATTPRNVLNIS